MADMPLGIKITCGYFLILGGLGLLAVALSGSYGVGGNVVACVILLFPAYLLLTRSKHARELSIAIVFFCALLAMNSDQRPSGLILLLIVLYLFLSRNVKAFYESN
ncbi:MAG: hypothetical protein J5674_05230 [Candidatus Methanomethylophilaceae archaeon]|nr:hypothetical protein [Candidatus Methanomethylophilaceae archaeon]